jgi:hypothetical protein
VEEELACSRWLSMNDNVAYRKILKCVTVKQIQILSLRGNTATLYDACNWWVGSFIPVAILY